MKERILEFLKEENKTAFQFAVEIGVQPSSVSHILSGRNNPSLDFVIKMLSRYNNLSPEWLLFGKGEMYKEKITNDLSHGNNSYNSERDVINEKNNLNVRSESKEYATNESKKIDYSNRDISNKKINKPAHRIIIFYDDNTFDEYFSE
ncbi:MAG TPA: helix-turn-helix transcriptional regulator [Bacteroidales bacterium]|nr:helix-turn-helix transcriptional regulator [Bacteroidales bacterium]HOU95651.1 helix-turn-helix transcriptional regulator [Bacteroidales bacterium]HQG36024.1 helix-turn-helix transcriptional regulator [Bacteroidales bacterium]HQG53170.1 helix-turn-helix transcriptional regulator [Bacteroidales bacterium]HQJ20340.1 helix-turn-helix transcriptional regulator [Bacteroidales bacterium]